MIFHYTAGDLKYIFKTVIFGCILWEIAKAGNIYIVMRRYLMPVHFLLLTACLSAEPKEPTKVVECSFAYWGSAPATTLYLRMGEYFHPMKCINGKRSACISLRRMKVFEVYEEVENAAEQDAGHKLVANIEVPEHYDKVLLLVLTPDEKQGTEHRLMVIDDSMDAFPASTFLFVNLGHKMITVNFAGESQDINANGMIAINSKVEKRGGLIPFVIHNDEGQKCYENRLFSQQRARNVIFIGPPKWDGGQPIVGLLPQLLPQKLP